MKISRRDFLKGSAATTLFLAGFNLPVLASSSRKKNLVVIMLRGGMDGLCAVPVIGDKDFEKRRKNILIENRLSWIQILLCTQTKSFPIVGKKIQSIVHATSIPYTARSHFEGQNLMESGGKYLYRKNWLGWKSYETW